MPRDGSGTFTRTDGTRNGQVWSKAEAAAVKIVSPDHDTHDQDIADAITDSVAKDGQTVMTGDQDFGTNDITNYGSEGLTLHAPVHTSGSPTFATGAYTYSSQVETTTTIGKLVVSSYAISATVVTALLDLDIVASVAPEFATAVTVGTFLIGGSKVAVTAILNTAGNIGFKDAAGVDIPVPSTSTTISIEVSVSYKTA